MDSQLKGLILNHTLKSYTITPIESNNVLEVTMKFYGVTSTRVLVRGEGTGSGRKGFWQSLRDPLLVAIPFLEPGHSPSPVALGGPVCSAIATAFMTQAEEMLQDMKDLCHQWDHLVQEAGKAKRSGRRCVSRCGT